MTVIPGATRCRAMSSKHFSTWHFHEVDNILFIMASFTGYNLEHSLDDIGSPIGSMPPSCSNNSVYDSTAHFVLGRRAQKLRCHVSAHVDSIFLSLISFFKKFVENRTT
jgi:hypothetical protein